MALEVGKELRSVSFHHSWPSSEYQTITRVSRFCRKVSVTGWLSVEEEFSCAGAKVSVVDAEVSGSAAGVSTGDSISVGASVAVVAFVASVVFVAFIAAVELPSSA